MEKAPYFINLRKASKIKHGESLETSNLYRLARRENDDVVKRHFARSKSGLFIFHQHEQIGMVYNGKAIFKIGDEERTAKKGNFHCIPANVRYSDTCVEDEPYAMLDIFYPAREDFIQKQRKTFS